MRAPLQELHYVPDSPPEKSHVHSDDLVGTSEIKPLRQNNSTNNEKNNNNEAVDFVYVSRPTKQPILLVGGCEDITIGRGGNATIKIGKRNRQISRIHARIEYEAETHQYYFHVLGLNGAMVDHVLYRQHDRILLKDDALIDILGSRITFMCPEDSVMAPIHRRQQAPVTPPSPQLEVVDDLEQQQQQQQQQQLASPVNVDDEDREIIVASPIEYIESPSHQLLEEPVQVVDEPIKAKLEQKQVDDEEEEFALDSQEQPLSPEPKDQIKEEEESNELGVDYAEVIIDALVFSRKSSMPISDICSRIMTTNPMYKSQSRQVWIEKIQKVLKEKPFFGEIVRKGKTADGSPKENLYYYNSQEDPVEWRRAEYTHVGRSARKCTLQDKQYFWKIPPKLGRNRNAYVPPPAKAYEKRKGGAMDENNGSSGNKKLKSDE
ncbi:hypothetical protein BDA99DRAFT_447633 [Phascolomyces articulosus]|uniref:FHA domain-containing protein n=1 Tax=Phascolomyces articulosus TaxID=60185 RepID=A0AAD5K0P6_9FUNG|nr:hypothetical protein BDA99DRAFT_447633 [Phascolomyces articulosus]